MSNMEFLIYEVQHDGDVSRVSGIVNKGVVPLNAEFICIRDESGGSSPVTLRVSDIVAYRRQLDELPKGMSGELRIEGDGRNRLAKDCMLAD